MYATLSYFDGCPNWKQTAAHLERLAGEVDGLSVSHRLVDSDDDARRVGFHGLPSVLIDGDDLFAEKDAPVGLSCRMYMTPEGPAGSPTFEQLRNEWWLSPERGDFGRTGLPQSGYPVPMTAPLPTPVGPLSDRTISALQAGQSPSDRAGDHLSAGNDPFDHDLQLALYVLNELHYGGWRRVDDRMEWDPGVQTLRMSLSDELERRLRDATADSGHVDPLAEADRLLDLDGPSISAYLRDHGSIEQVRESMILRSPYQSKEADPHTFALPRFSGPTKRVFCEIQSGEYGVGHRRSHAELFADAMNGLDIDPTPNAHIDRCSGAALAVSNLVSLGSLQRRLRGIVLGQLSLFEMDSVVPNQRMVDCVDRLGLPDSVRPFFFIHVLADEEHQEMVRSAFLTDYPAIEPDQLDNLLVGMRSQSLIDHALAAQCVPAWRSDRSALASRSLVGSTA